MNIATVNITPDLINAAFNVCGSIAISSSIYKLYQDKLVRGIHWGMLIFFISWSTWNLYFYSHLAQWYSFMAGCLMVVAEGTYLILLFYYSRQEAKSRDAYSLYLQSIESAKK